VCVIRPRRVAGVGMSAGMSSVPQNLLEKALHGGSITKIIYHIAAKINVSAI
jgi:hypothetical protein